MNPLHQQPSPPEPEGAAEEPVRTFIVEGQRQELWLRCVLEDDVWHNAAIFRRDGKLSPMEAWITGLDWHLPPDQARARAHALDETEILELYERALRPRPPLI
ncbi:MAG TPA: hypothetical protein VF039_04375 [Longimicrobiales bacterium]